MAHIYVTEQGAYLKKDGPLIKVSKNSDTILEIHTSKVESMVLFGGVQVTSQALLALVDAGSAISFMTANGHFRAQMRSSRGKNSILRYAQFDRSRDQTFCLPFARELVAAKVKNSVELLKRYRRNTNNPSTCPNLDKIKTYQGIIRKADSLEQLRGYEGNAAKLYFSDFAELLLGEAEFKGRKYHPSPDPVNALLSFGYSFIAREMEGILEANDLDPYIGFFHQLDYGRASLSLDMIEPFRHIIVDRLVLKILNKRIITTDDFFYKDNGGCYLQKEGLKKFVKFYEEYADEKNLSYGEKESISFRKIMWQQVEQLKKSLINGVEFQPFVYTD